MNREQIERVFGRERLKMATGAHVEVYREAAAPGESRRYTKRFLTTAEGDYAQWTEREWRILARLIGHGTRCVPDVVQYDRGAQGTKLVQTYDAGATVDQWATLLPVERDGRVHAHVFEDCAHWWALAHHCLVALDEIHTLQLVHLDVKGDNICIPIVPAGFDPYAHGQILFPAFHKLALIDFAFSLVSGETLTTPLPIGWEQGYDYQSPRLLKALEAGRAGDLGPTESLDWRCDMYSLAAMLKRYLPSEGRLYRGDESCGWTPDRYESAKLLILGIREAHDNELAQPRPHAELIAQTSAQVREPELARSLDDGWTLARHAQPAAVPATPLTPVTRLAPPLRIVVPPRDDGSKLDAATRSTLSPHRGDSVAAIGANRVVRGDATSASSSLARERRVALAAVAVAAVTLAAAAAVPLIGFRAPFGFAVQTVAERADEAARTLRAMLAKRFAPEEETHAPAAALPDRPAAAAAAPDERSQTHPAVAAAEPHADAASPAETSNVEMAAAPASRSAAQSSIVPPAAPMHTPTMARAARESNEAASTQPPSRAARAARSNARASANPASKRANKGGRAFADRRPRVSPPIQSARASLPALARAAPERTSSPDRSGSASVAGRAATATLARITLATPGSGKLPPDLVSAANVTAPAAAAIAPIALASTPSTLPAEAVAVVGAPAPEPRIASDASPRTSDASPGRAQTQLAAPPLVSPPLRSPAPIVESSRPSIALAERSRELALPPRESPRSRVAPIEAREATDYLVEAQRVLSDVVPRTSGEARARMARVLWIAGNAQHPAQESAVVEAAYAIAGGDFVTPPDAARAAEARRLHEEARRVYALRRSAPAALDFELRAFGANPADTEIAGQLAFLYLKLMPAQPERARQLALHAIGVRGGRAGPGRIEDWTTFAIASALTGREAEARDALYATLALGGSVDRACRIAFAALATYGERLRDPVEALLYRLQAQGRADESPYCAGAPHRIAGWRYR